MNPSKYTKHIDRDRIIKIVSDLISINTVNPPGNEHLVLPIVKPLLEDLGMEVTIYEKEHGRTNIVGKLGSGKKSVAFISHMDTVPPGDRELWDTDPFTPVVKEGKMYGRGSLDDKGSFAASYSACKAFIAENPNFDGTIYLLAAADEELGSRLGVIYLLQEENFRVDACIIPDGGEMDQAVLGEKGILHLDLVSYGKQAHGSLPSLGRNAIVPLAELVTELKNIKLSESYDKQFDGWTMNIGVMQGGIAANVVPAKATLSLDFRFPTGITKEDIIEQVQKKIDVVKQRDPEAKIEIKESLATKPHMITVNEPIVQSFDGACKKLGLPMNYGTMGGNTVAKNFYDFGITSIVHYPGDHHVAHVPNEFVPIDNMIEASILYAETLEEFFGTLKDAAVRKSEEEVPVS